MTVDILEVLQDKEMLKQALETALSVQEKRGNYDGLVKLESSEMVGQVLRARLAGNAEETFGMLMLDNRHRLIDYAELFRGAIDAITLYPRAIVRKVLENNAAAVVFVHNHPSGDPTSSQQDVRFTDRIKGILDDLDVRVLDHFVVGAQGAYSIASQRIV